MADYLNSTLGAFFANTKVLANYKQHFGVTLSVEKLFNNASPLQKNQMYNWFDRYKPQDKQKVYILGSDIEKRSKLNLSLVKRLKVQKA